MLTDYKNRMEMIERTANLADPVIGAYILKAVTEEYSFNYLKMQMDIPCAVSYTHIDVYKRQHEERSV